MFQNIITVVSGIAPREMPRSSVESDFIETLTGKILNSASLGRAHSTLSSQKSNEIGICNELSMSLENLAATRINVVLIAIERCPRQTAEIWLIC